MITKATAIEQSVKNHQRAQTGGRILKLTIAGFELAIPSEFNDRTKKRYVPGCKLA